jgi:hypothetical protein
MQLCQSKSEEGGQEGKTVITQELLNQHKPLGFILSHQRYSISRSPCTGCPTHPMNIILYVIQASSKKVKIITDINLNIISC